MPLLIQFAKAFSAFIWTKTLLVLFTVSTHWFISWVKWHWPPHHPFYLRYILILSCHISVCVLSRLS